MKLVLASGNSGKIRELTDILSQHNITVYPQSDFNTPEADETGLSFIENAILKARNASEYSKLPAIADDSGLEVDALNGAPGIYSARYAGEHANDQTNNTKLLAALDGISEEQRTARYQCAIALVRHPEDPTPLIFCGHWEGKILTALQGDGGFGYDPLFFVSELGKTAAEIEKTQKNSISHRGKAMQQLLNNTQALVSYLS